MPLGKRQPLFFCRPRLLHFRFCFGPAAGFLKAWITLSLGLVIRPSTGIGHGSTAAVHCDCCFGHTVQKIAVVADQNHCALIFIQQLLQQIKRFDIKIIGGLV